MKDILNKYRAVILLVFSGLLTAIPVAFPKLGFLQWISAVPAALILLESAECKELRLRKIWGRGLLFFWTYYAVVFHWFFYMYPLDFAGLSNFASVVVVLFACFGLSFLQALFSAFAFLIIGYLSRTETARRFPMVCPFLGAAVWTVAEWFQTVGWWGVPWGRLPLGQVEAPLLLRSASLFGSYFVTFIILAVNFCIAYVILHRNTKKILSAVAVLLFCLNLAAGSLVTLLYREEGEQITVAAAQGNIPSADKWDSSSLERNLGIYEGLTVSASANGASVIVWPETAIPYDFFSRYDLQSYMSSLAKENEITILFSAFTSDEESGMLRNSIIEVRPDGSFGETVYHKQRLVPFGEFVPMRRLVMFLVPPLAEIGMLSEDLMAGEESVVFQTSVGRVGCGICFDSIYEDLIRSSVQNGAEIIAISTNDSWFGDSAALAMHNSQSILRAIENGRYVVRSANTGISSVIDPMGNVVEALEADREGYVIADACMRQQTTLYTRIGNVFVYICMTFAAGIWLSSLYFIRKKASQD
ncbi:MAG: apolipoprotein N-acyltransferase [Clostridia bacterium]|nr:apolipoprotein N-acyltransferase [Clostridia bacterium]